MCFNFCICFICLCHIIHDEFVSVNNVLREYNEIKEEEKGSMEYIIYKQSKRIPSVLKKVLQTKIQMLEKPNKIDCFYQIVLFVAKKWTFFKNQEVHNFNNISND